MNKKIFFIGFNKTATTALHHLVGASGYVSVHCLYRVEDTSRFIARQMHDNVKEGNPILKDIDKAHAYSDMLYVKQRRYIEGNKYYRKLHEEYPDSYFVLQTRNIDDWLKSRLYHKDGAFVKRCMKFQNCTQDELLMQWSFEKKSREKAMKFYFRDNPNFLVFDIDKDPIDKLINHISPDFELDKRRWRRLNETV